MKILLEPIIYEGTTENVLMRDMENGYTLEILRVDVIAGMCSRHDRVKLYEAIDGGKSIEVEIGITFLEQE